MNNMKILNVQSLNQVKRLDYFIRKVTDCEVIWGSYGESGWLLLSDKNGRKIVPFWPEKEFVNEYNVTHQYEYFPKKMDLYYFLDKWINGLTKDKIVNTPLLAHKSSRKSCYLLHVSIFNWCHII